MRASFAIDCAEGGLIFVCKKYKVKIFIPKTCILSFLVDLIQFIAKGVSLASSAGQQTR